MQLESFNKLEQAVAEFDFVLIGLGEEWVLTEEDILGDLAVKNLVLKELFDKARKEERYSKTVMLFMAYYFKKYIPQQFQRAYASLWNLIKDKNYFIVSLAVDTYLNQMGFDKDRCVNPCGRFDVLQCSQGCCEMLVSSEDIIVSLEKILSVYVERDTITPEEVEKTLMQCVELMEQHKCSECGSDLSFNILDVIKYREEGYLDQWQNYMKWLQGTLNKKLCVIEAGVGMKLPSVIRWPFEKTVFYNQKSNMFRIHEKFYQVNEEVSDRAWGCKCNAVKLFGEKQVEAK